MVHIGELKATLKMVNHKTLLAKYIRFVRLAEGVDFIHRDYRSELQSDIEFSDEEWSELERLSAERAATKHQGVRILPPRACRSDNSQSTGTSNQ